MKWHRKKFGSYYAVLDNRIVAEADCTGRPGVDDYPWDWALTRDGEALRKQPDAPGISRGMGAADTLRSVKNNVAWLLGVS